MRVSHLLETTDFSPLAKILQGRELASIVLELKEFGDDEAKLLAIVLQKAIEKSSISPESLFSYMEPLIDAKAADGKLFKQRYMDFTYVERLADVLNGIVSAVLKMDPPPIKLLKSKIDINKLNGAIDRDLSVKLKLADWKVSRTRAEKKFDDANQQYVFIGRPVFKEEPGGKYIKTLEIERMVPMDIFDPDSHKMVGMMQMRARHQGEKSEVYSVTLPKGMLDDNTEVPEWIIDTIDKHKTQVS
jgi:hypothetical protein